MAPARTFPRSLVYVIDLLAWSFAIRSFSSHGDGQLASISVPHQKEIVCLRKLKFCGTVSWHYCNGAKVFSPVAFLSLFLFIFIVVTFHQNVTCGGNDLWGKMPKMTCGGILKVLILQHIVICICNPKSNTSYLVVIRYWHVSLHYFCICDFVWRHIWRHSSPFGSSAFFVKNVRLNWDRKSRMTHCDSTELPNRLICVWPPSSIYVWPERGGWSDLDLGVNLDFDLY